MSKGITFSVAGRPQATARPRVLKNGGSFMPKTTVAAQRMVAEAALVAAGSKRPLWPTGCVSVAVNACFGWPAGTAKKRILPGWTPMPKKPDVENLAKTVLDGMTGIVYTDDNQVVELTISKWRTDNPAQVGFHIEVWPVPEGAWEWRPLDGQEQKHA